MGPLTDLTTLTAPDHETVVRPLTCGYVLWTGFGQAHPWPPLTNPRDRRTSVQVRACFLDGKSQLASTWPNPLVRPLTCTNTPLTTNGHIAEPLRHNEIHPDHSLPLRGVRAYARAHTRAYARGAGLPTNPSKGEKP